MNKFYLRPDKKTQSDFLLMDLLEETNNCFWKIIDEHSFQQLPIESTIKVKVCTKNEYVLSDWNKKEHLKSIDSILDSLKSCEQYIDIPDEWRKWLEKLIQLFEELKNEIENSTKKNRGVPLENIKDHINDQVKENLLPESLLKDVEKTISRIDRETRRIAGCYKDTSKTIELYENVLGDYHLYSEKWETTFAHELFHAYHYALADGNDLTGANNNGKIVKESLARSFEIQYAEMRGFREKADRLSEEAKQHDMHYWSYAGSKHIRYGEEFFYIFDLSLKDINNAFDILVVKKLKDENKLPSFGR